MRGLVMIAPEAPLQRATRLEEGRFAWASGFPMVMEKHGHVAHEVCGAEALSDPELWEAGVPVIVARAPDALWTRDVVELVAGSHSPVLVEGPPPRALARRLGLNVDTLGPFGSVVATDPHLKQLGARYAPAGGTVMAPTLREVQHDRDLDWSRFDAIPIDGDHANAWRAPGWDACSLSNAGGGTTLAEWHPVEAPRTRLPALVQHDRLIVTSFGLLAFLAQAHSAEPVDGVEFRSWPRTLGLEAIAMGLIDRLYEMAGLARARVLPWPVGRSWALTVRHDVDRPARPTSIRAALDMHEAVGTSATWYWRTSNLSDVHRSRPTASRRRFRGTRRIAPGAARQAVRLVAAEPRHEVALHTEHPWGSDDELGALERVSGRPVRGTSAHGDPLMFRWQGAPNVLWAEHLECDYTELIQQAHVHPHRFLTADASGRVRPLRVLCLPHHESFERSTRPGDVAADEVLSSAQLFTATGGLMQVLNHPDINLDALAHTLAQLPVEGRIDCTAAQATDWWRRTHVAGELTLTPERGGWSLASRRGVRDLAVEVVSPSGEEEVRAFTIAPGQRAVLERP